MSKRLLPIKAMCARYGDVADRTIDRWTEAGILPPPLVINRRRYWDEEELERREREGMRRRQGHERNLVGGGEAAPTHTEAG